MAYKKKTENLIRCFHIEMLVELIPIHQELQRVYNLILNDDNMRFILLNEINYTVGTGEIWNQMGRFFKKFIYSELQEEISLEKEEIEKLKAKNKKKPKRCRLKEIPTTKIVEKIPNKAWFARMVYENLRRTVESQRDKVEIFEVLKDHDFKIDKKLKDELYSMELYTTRGGLESLKDAGKPPELPRQASFVMDYSIYDKQMFLMDKTDNTKMKFRYTKEDWVDLDIVLPLSIRLNMTGKLGQPSFYFKNGQYVGDIRYYVKPYKQEESKNILGVDYGKKYVYSASVLYEDGTTSQQYLPSKRLQSLNVKKEKVMNEVNLIKRKIERTDPYLASKKVFGSTVKKQKNRLKNDLDNRQKLINIKEEEATLSAVELVEIAIQNKCSEIHIDYLKWLKSKGGKWNFSACQEKLMSISELFGVEVVTVNTANSSQTHPITKEIGKEVGRDIVFSNGERIDRDYVASINHAKRNRFKDKDKPEKEVKKINKRSHKKVKRISNREIKRKMKEVLDKKRDSEIVVFSPVQPEVTHERCLEIGFIAKHSLAKGHVFENLALPRGSLKGVIKCH